MHRLAILYDAGQAVLSTVDLDEVVSRILAIVRDVFQLYKGAIFLVDAKCQELYIKSQFGWEAGKEKARVPLGSGLTGTAAQTKKPVYAADVAQDPHYINSLADTRSEVAFPLIVREEVVGVLDCQTDFFDEETRELLRLFSTQASIALANARLYSLEQRRLAQLKAINAIAKQTTGVLEIDELLKEVCLLTLKSLGGDHASVVLIDDERLILWAHKGSLTPLVKIGEDLPSADGTFARVIHSRKATVEKEVSQFPGQQRPFRETRSAVYLPLISLGQVLGLLMLDSASSDAFDSEDERAGVGKCHLRGGHPERTLLRSSAPARLHGWFNRNLQPSLLRNAYGGGESSWWTSITSSGSTMTSAIYLEMPCFDSCPVSSASNSGRVTCGAATAEKSSPLSLRKQIWTAH